MAFPSLFRANYLPNDLATRLQLEFGQAEAPRPLAPTRLRALIAVKCALGV